MTVKPAEVRPRLLEPPERTLVLVVAVAITAAQLFPYPATKNLLMLTVGAYVLRLVFTDFPLAVCLLPLLIPAQNLVPKDTFAFVPGLNYETFLILLLLAAWVAFRSSREHERPAGSRPAFATLTMMFIGLLALSGGQTLLSGYAGAWDLFSKFKNEFIYVFLFFIVADVLRTERDRVRFMVAVCLAVFLLSIQPVYTGTEKMAHGVNLERHRAVSIMALQPNIYGGALAVFLSFPIVYFARGFGGKKGRILMGLVVGTCTYALVLTLSRGSWLALGASTVLVGLLFERRVLLILVLGAALGPLWIPDQAVDRAETIQEIDVSDPNLQDEEGSSFVRVDQWRMILPVLADSPILGHGYGTFPRLYGEFGSMGVEKGAHVGYAEYAGEVGLPGLALYVLIFVTLGFFGARLAREGPTDFARAHGSALAGAALAMMVAECFGSRFKVGTVTTFLWFYAAAGAAFLRWPAAAPAPESAPVLRQARPPRPSRRPRIVRNPE